MARPQDGHLWGLVQAERAALAEDLADLSAEQWRHATLCGEWDVEQVRRPPHRGSVPTLRSRLHESAR